MDVRSLFFLFIFNFNHFEYSFKIKKRYLCTCGNTFKNPGTNDPSICTGTKSGSSGYKCEGNTTQLCGGYYGGNYYNSIYSL